MALCFYSCKNQVEFYIYDMSVFGCLCFLHGRLSGYKCGLELEDYVCNQGKAREIVNVLRFYQFSPKNRLIFKRSSSV